MCVCVYVVLFSLKFCFVSFFASLFSKEREKEDVELEEWEVRG